MQISYLICLQAKFMGHTFWKLLCRFKIDGQKLGVNAKASHILISYEGTKVPNKKEQRTKEAKVS
jgi:peptidyl-prolyl cis-trans isomerase D